MPWEPKTLTPEEQKLADLVRVYEACRQVAVVARGPDLERARKAELHAERQLSRALLIYAQSFVTDHFIYAVGRVTYDLYRIRRPELRYARG
jgi:hypothetical protein